MILKPAYGRKYATLEDCKFDWFAGKDFKIMNGPYCSIRDIEMMKKDFNIIEILWAFDMPTWKICALF